MIPPDETRPSCAHHEMYPRQLRAPPPDFPEKSMSSHVTECQVCGHMSEDLEWCDNCGASLATRDATQQGDVKEWLELGETFVMRCDIEELFQTIEHGEGEVTVRFVLAEVVEASSVRHISVARLDSIIEVHADIDPDVILKALEGIRFTVEELGAILGAHDDDLPVGLTHLVRLPVGQFERDDHIVRLFREDGSVTLEEFVHAHKGRVPYRLVCQVFHALLDLVEQLHGRGHLYLRLSPWTLRIVQSDQAAHEALGLEEPTSPDESAVSPDEDDETLDMEGVRDLLEKDEDDDDEGSRDLFLFDRSHDSALVADSESLSVAIEEPPTPSLIQRVLLDGGFRFYEPGESYGEIPVVIGFSPQEMFGLTQAKIDVACDIFSLGMLLYYLIAGELPPTSVYTRHTPALPARHFRPEFPIGFQSVIGRATRPDPAQRYHDVATMRATFERASEVISRRTDQMHQPRSPRIDLAVETHIGIGKRMRNPVNQDAVFGETSSDSLFSLVVVADGVSTASYGSGDLASGQLSDVAHKRWPEILERYESGDPIDEFEIIHELLRESNERIVEYVNTHCSPFEGNPHEVMGTTSLVAVIHDGIVTVGSLGDSRVYVQRGTSLEQVTIDHNLWTLSILDGVAADSALSLPHGDALARCLGTFYIEKEALVALPPQPDIFRFPIASGDTMLMTTDGLLDFAGANALASEDNILSIMLSESNPSLAALEMILLANRGGGGDNIGIGILKFI